MFGKCLIIDSEPILSDNVVRTIKNAFEFVSHTDKRSSISFMMYSSNKK